MVFDVKGAIYFLVTFVVLVVAVFFFCQYLDKKSQVIQAECEANNQPIPRWVKIARVVLKRSLNE
jgi:C4-dicarboxylate transporter